jgi:outer membrane protein assembly factor BamE (lipoprotein component of BamABCDE complex)
MTRLQLLLAALFLASCAATGTPRQDDVFERIAPGMTRDDVRAMAGSPDNVMPFPLSGNTSWGWLYWDRFGYYVEFSVTFAPDGRVVSRNVRRLNEGGDMH